MKAFPFQISPRAGQVLINNKVHLDATEADIDTALGNGDSVIQRAIDTVNSHQALLFMARMPNDIHVVVAVVGPSGRPINNMVQSAVKHGLSRLVALDAAIRVLKPIERPTDLDDLDLATPDEVRRA